MHINQPKGVKLKIKECKFKKWCKLERGVKQKCVKQTGIKRPWYIH